MALDLPATGRLPTLAGGAIALALTGLGLLALSCAERGMDEELEALIEVWDQGRPELERCVEDRILADFSQGLRADSPWRQELEANAGLLGELGREHLSQVFRRVGGGSDWVEYRCALDFLAETVDEPDVPLTEALPSVRVVDLTVVLSSQREVYDVVRRVELRPGGGRLDGEVCILLSAYFEDAGVAVLLPDEG